jgi:hypothetical protein
VLGPVGLMTPPGTIGSQDHADEFVDELMDELTGAGTGPGSDGEDQDEDSGDADTPPNFWQVPINTGPVSFDKPVNDPVTSGSDGVVENGTVDNGPGNPQ